MELRIGFLKRKEIDKSFSVFTKKTRERTQK